MTHDTLRTGDIGAAVQTLQRRLNHHGASLSVDHVFGAKTEAAVRAFQRQNDLVVDGIAGPVTTSMLASRPVAPSMRHADITAAAATLEVDAASILAVMEVEAPGTGYLRDGRLRILFERHIMYRQMKAAGIDPDPYVKTAPDIVNPQRGGYLGGAAEYARLAKAKRIHTESALSSASWGRFQILGLHHAALGFATAADFVAAIKTGPAEQLRIFCRFVEQDQAMHKALQTHDWAAFARAYNGPAYADNQYDQRLAMAWARQGGQRIATAPPAAPAAKPARRRQTKATQAKA